MKPIYNIAIHLYNLGIHLSSPFNKKAKLLLEGRKQSENMLNSFKRENGKLIWFHAASLGEFEQGRPVIEAIKEQFPGVKILLTFFSPSGYEIRKNYKGADTIMYLPADTPKRAASFIKKIKPDIAVFIKYEYWYNFLNSLNKDNIPTILISAIFRKSQPFFKFWGGTHREMLSFFNKIYVQDEESINLLKTIGIQSAIRTGDTRFDRVKQIADEAKHITKVEEFLNDDSPVVVCGSTWPPDEDIICKYINAENGKWKWIIAPHEIDESRIKGLVSKLHVSVARFSENNSNHKDADVLIIDCIGILSSIYRYGNIAYIGGGFGVGIHNTLEAAVYGIPVMFGTNYKKFGEAISLINCNGAICIHNANEFSVTMNKFFKDRILLKQNGNNAQTYVNSMLGATKIICKDIISFLTTKP